MQAAPSSPSPSAARLALARLDAQPASALPPWSAAEATAIQRQAARQLHRKADAAKLLSPVAGQLVEGIALVPYLAPQGAFGPAWPAHPFASPAMGARYRLREPDLTRALAGLMDPSSGRQGARRAVSFLRILTELTGHQAVLETLTDQTHPTVIAEHGVVAPRRRSLGAAGKASSRTRIDLLFEWPIGVGSQRAVVVIEAKLGAVVSDGQLVSYREEALRRAKGGPVALILLTATADNAERRYRSWTAVRWFSLLRRWEAALAEAGDTDPEFARVRAHLWRFVLSTGRIVS